MHSFQSLRNRSVCALVAGLFLTIASARAADATPDQPSTQEKVKERVHRTAKTVKEGASKVGNAVEHGASLAVNGIKKGAAKADHAIRHVAHKVDPKRNPETP